MALSSTHPKYDAKLADWELMRDCYEGERTVKMRGEKYLPATPGMVLDGMQKATDAGYLSYQAYKNRAVFPDHVKDAVKKAIGLMHNKPAIVELPAGMEMLLEKTTREGENIHCLLRRINEQQLLTGRLGLMLDLPLNPDPANPMPYVALYDALSIRNWDESADGVSRNALNVLVLDESTDVRSLSLEWVRKERYRVLAMVPASTGQDPGPQQDLSTGDTAKPDDVTELGGALEYRQAVFDVTEGGSDINYAAMVAPVLRGQTLEQIPFIIINSQDVVVSPDAPPLLGLANLALAIYRGEADYRQNLFMQGQDTLVTIGSLRNVEQPLDGSSPAVRVGAGARIELDAVPGADAKYIGVTSDGLAEQRECIQGDKEAADAKAGTLISPDAGKQESGDALHTRIAAQTASITQIAKAGAEGLQAILRIAAVWLGKDPNAVIVTPNLDFAPAVLSGDEVTKYMSARMLGAPLSLKSLHGVFVGRGLTTMTYEDELAQIEKEDMEIATRTAALPQPLAPAPAPGPRNEPGNAE